MIEILRSTFFKLPPHEQARMMRDRSHVVVNDPPPPLAPPIPGAVSRKHFEKLSATDKRAILSQGRVITDRDTAAPDIGPAGMIRATDGSGWIKE